MGNRDASYDIYGDMEVAMHEAGHAVAAVLLGASGVTIDLNAPGDEHTDCKWETPANSILLEQYVINRFISVFAGTVAKWRYAHFDSSSGVAQHDDKHDFSGLRIDIQEYPEIQEHFDQLQARAWEQSIQFANQHFHEIGRVAKRLIELKDGTRRMLHIDIERYIKRANNNV